MTRAATFNFSEIASEVFTFDEERNSEDLGGDPASAPPLVIPGVSSGFSGRGREFGDDIGLQGPELAIDSLRLTRDFTARAFVLYKIGAALNGDRATLVARGRRGSAAERLIFGLELERVNDTTARVRARWEEIGGGAAVVAGVTFQPDPDEFCLVSVVRHWVDTNTVDLRYFVDDREIGSETVSEGDIGEGVGGTLTIGCVGDALGDYERFLPAGSVIDNVFIDDDAISFEEIRQDFRRVTVHQPDGYRIIRSYVPPGVTWSKDPDSRVQRWLASEGDLIGFALSQGIKLREDHLPDRAYGQALIDWERVVRVTPKPLETIEERRATVLAALRKILGYTLDGLKAALEPLFELASVDIEIIEFGALREDDFAFDDITPATPSNMWITKPGVGTVAIAAGLCTASIPAGNPNAQWPTDPTGGGDPPHRETSLTGGELGGEPDDAVILIDVDATADITNKDVLCGVFMRNLVGDEAVFFGVIDDSGAYELASYSIVSGVRSALAIHGAGGAGVDRLLLRSLGGGLYQVGTVAGGVPTIISSAVVGPTAPRWAGFGAFSRKVSSKQQDADFDDAQVFEPNTGRGFGFLAFRDPGLGGTFNLEKSQAQLDKQDPAHVRGLAVDDGEAFFELGDGGKLGVGFLMPRVS